MLVANLDSVEVRGSGPLAPTTQSYAEMVCGFGSPTPVLSTTMRSTGPISNRIPGSAKRVPTESPSAAIATPGVRARASADLTNYAMRINLGEDSAGRKAAATSSRQ